VIGIVVFAEMTGRVATVSRHPILVDTHIHAIVANVTVWLRFDYLEPTGMRWTRERGDVALWRLATRGPWWRPNAGDLFA
jgi:hypothetical protein